MTSSYVKVADKYISDVLSGKVPACKWVTLACERQQKDRARWKGKGGPYYWDAAAAERNCRFMERLPHIKGDWARRGEKINLEPWQVFIQTTVYGWKRSDTGKRRFRTVYEEVARKNAKSTRASGNGLFMLSADDEAGAEVYSAATTRDQAKIIFADAQTMARKEPGLRERFGIEVNAHNISILDKASKFEALSAEGNSLDGLNIHCALVDELHAHQTRKVYDVLETATGSRSQPIIWIVTTAGTNRAGICYEVRTYLTKILEGVAQDETFFGVIYTIDDGDDWQDRASWAKANPNLGISVYEDDIARLAAKAAQMPSALNNFLTKRLNVWVNADTAWMPPHRWDACADPSLDIEDFAGEKCHEGVDLASKIDIAARVKVFSRIIDGATHYYMFGKYYLPEGAVQNAANSQYEGWEREGRLITTPGDTLDFQRIEDDIVDESTRFQTESIGVDPWQAAQFAQRLMARGATVFDFRQIVQNMSAPMQELQAAVFDKRLHHDGDPVMAWMVSNVVCHMDAKDNIYPRKERPENKIDGVVAAIIAIGRVMVEPLASAYDSRGVVFV